MKWDVGVREMGSEGNSGQMISSNIGLGRNGKTGDWVVAILVTMHMM